MDETFNFNKIPPNFKKKKRFIEGLKQGLFLKAGENWLPTHKLFPDQSKVKMMPSEYVDSILEKAHSIVSKENSKPTPNGSVSNHLINYKHTEQEILTYKWVDPSTSPRLGLIGYSTPGKGTRVEMTDKFIYGLKDDTLYAMPTPPELSEKLLSIFKRTPNRYKGSKVGKEISTGKAEEELKAQGKRFVIGIDEAGRGSWAGPLVAGAFLMDLDNIPEVLNKVKDSKALEVDELNELSSSIKESGIYGIGIVTAEEINKGINLDEANKKAFLRAISQIQEKHPNIDHILVDGLSISISDYYPNSTQISQGEQTSKSIAAASILAKSTHDRIMEEIETKYPQWKFSENVGYGTKTHKNLIDKHGICPEHRTTFKPIRKALERISSLDLL